jgi:LysR family glycine cleavage system transcriptional activator
LLKHTLIHHRSADAWRSWLRSYGVSAPVKGAQGLVVNEMSLAIDAAVSGQGIALARSALAHRDLTEGRLVRPMLESRPANFAYWIVFPPTSASLPKVTRFREWLVRGSGADLKDMRGGVS